MRWAGKRPPGIERPAGGGLDSDDLRSLVDDAERAMTEGRPRDLRGSLLALADTALSWAGEIPDEAEGG